MSLESCFEKCTERIELLSQGAREQSGVLGYDPTHGDPDITSAASDMDDRQRQKAKSQWVSGRKPT